MISALSNQDHLISHLVNQSMLKCNSSRPIARPIIFQRFRLSYARKRLHLNIFDEKIYSFYYFLIIRLPVYVVIPSLISKNKAVHSKSSLSLPSPASNCCIASFKREALLILCIRYAVSSMDLKSLSDKITTGSLFCRVTTIGE